MATLLLAEVVGGALSDMTVRALTAALEIGQPVDVLVAGHNVGTAVEAAAKLAGVAKVRVADDPVYAHALAEPTAALIVSLAPAYDAIVAPSTASAKNIAPRAAALLDVMQVSDITKVLGPKTFERPIYAGNAIQTVESTDPKIVVTVRTAAFGATGQGGEAAIEPVAAAGDPGVSSFVGEALAKSDLTSAKIIVSGASGSTSASVLMRIPRSAMTISVALPASLCRSASPTAILSNGFIDILTLASSTPDPSELVRITRIAGTRIFMDGEPPPCRLRPWLSRPRGNWRTRLESKSSD